MSGVSVAFNGQENFEKAMKAFKGDPSLVDEFVRGLEQTKEDAPHTDKIDIRLNGSHKIGMLIFPEKVR